MEDDSLKPIAGMAALRGEIDALDRVLVSALARRAAMIDRAVEIKRREGLAARIDSRVEEVVANVRGAAEEAGLDADMVERMWRALIEWSIAREEKALSKPNAA